MTTLEMLLPVIGVGIVVLFLFALAVGFLTEDKNSMA